MIRESQQLAPAEQGYVPVEEWPDVTAMLDGFGDPSLPQTDKLVGKPVDLVFAGGRVIRHVFLDDSVTWEITAGEGSGVSGTHAYRAVEVRPGIFFIDFLKGDGPHSKDVSIVLDSGAGRALVAESSFVDRDGQIRMTTDVQVGRVAGEDVVPFERTSALVGKRIYYRYSPTEHYEHVYLNSGTFVWHCIRGAEVGLADADPVQMWEIADGLVLLHWSETVMPVESIVTIDLERERSIGRMFCWDRTTLDTVHIPFDSRFTVLGGIDYPSE